MNYMFKIKYFILLILLVTTTACREGYSIVYDPEDEGFRSGITKTLSEQFNYLWTGINNCYVFWSCDPLNWDSIYDAYLPQFEALDNKALHGNTISNEEISKLMEATFGKLLDRHLTAGIINPYTDGKETKNVYVQTGMIDIKSRPDYHSDPIYKAIAKDSSYILIDDYYITLYQKSVSKYNVSQLLYAQENAKEGEWYAYSCLLNGNIPYLKMSNFYISNSEHTKEMNNVLQNFFNNVRNLNKAERLGGVILDNRGNPGGYTNDLNYIPGLFIEEPITLFRRRTKSGLGRYDYEGWTDVIVQSTKNLQQISDFKAPFVALQDMHSISLGEVSSFAISKLPTGYVIGENTMGAFGTLLQAFDIYHAGGFNYANSATEPFVYCTTYQSSVLNENTGKWEVMEGNGGFAPDEYVALDTLALRKHDYDNQLDAALEYISKQTK